MDPKTWKDIEEYFHRACEMTPIQQQEFLDELKNSKPAVAEEVRKMLESHHSAGSFLEESILDENYISKGERIGPWKILDEIGKGGMSTVYLAQRDDGTFDRKVAVKFLHGMMPGSEMYRRMIAEQKILARLQHKNIAQLYDAGITDNGRPYFILEFIDGTSLVEWCNKRKLNFEDRLTIFEQVCEAVQFAHKRLIVHRDLKPNNILIDQDGTVKLLDFGIAKILESDTKEETPITRTGLFLMTPEYASPEQVKDNAITTATDVYQLGLLLCELLTGSLPYDIDGKKPLEAGAVIIGKEPKKPSTLITSAQAELQIKHSSPRQLKKRLQGDIDNIVLKALRKEPERRYDSSSQMLDDIRRYRKNLPVLARPEDSLYRSRKFIQRNRTAVASAVIILFVLIASLIYSQNQARIAERERENAQRGFENIQELAGTMIFDIYDNIAELPGSTPSREIIVERALVYLDQLASNTTPDESLHLYLAEAYRKIGDVQGNPTNANLGLHREALESYQTALDYLIPIVDNNVENLNAQEALAMLHGRISDIFRTLGNLAESREHMTQSLEQYEHLRNQSPDNPNIIRSFALANIKMGDLLGNPNFTSLEMPVRALDYYGDGEKILKPLYESNPDNVFNTRLLGLVYERIGDIYSYQGSFDRAATYFQDSMELRKKLAEMDPSNNEALRDEAIAYEKLADVHQQNGNLDGALTNYLMSMEIFTRLADIDPRNVQAQQSLAISYLHLGDLHYSPDNNSFQDAEKALNYFNQSFEILQQVYDTDGSNIRTERLISILDRRKNMMEEL